MHYWNDNDYSKLAAIIAALLLCLIIFLINSSKAEEDYITVGNLEVAAYTWNSEDKVCILVCSDGSIEKISIRTNDRTGAEFICVYGKKYNHDLIELDSVAVSNPYVAEYIAPAEGDPDWHNPYATDYCYGGMHHRAGDNCPESYYILLKVWQFWGEKYEAGEINLNQLKELEHYIFAEPKGCWLYEDVMAACDKFARKKGIG